MPSNEQAGNPEDENTLSGKHTTETTSLEEPNGAQPLNVSQNMTTYSKPRYFESRRDLEEPIAKPEAGDEYVTGIKLVAVVSCVALGCFLMLVDTMVISTAIPRITDEFHSLVDVGWYASAYQFGISAPQPLIGKVYTHFKTKWTYLFCFAVFELGSVLCDAAVSSTMLIVGRAVAGLGASGIINGAITILSGCAPLEKRPCEWDHLRATWRRV
ncbi:major facilitator superfamily domain-containing protein, partial [Whalleya microplaca]